MPWWWPFSGREPELIGPLDDDEVLSDVDEELIDEEEDIFIDDDSAARDSYDEELPGYEEDLEGIVYNAAPAPDDEELPDYEEDEEDENGTGPALDAYYASLPARMRQPIDELFSDPEEPVYDPEETPDLDELYRTYGPESPVYDPASPAYHASERLPNTPRSPVYAPGPSTSPTRRGVVRQADVPSEPLYTSPTRKSPVHRHSSPGYTAPRSPVYEGGASCTPPGRNSPQYTPTRQRSLDYNTFGYYNTTQGPVLDFPSRNADPLSSAPPFPTVEGVIDEELGGESPSRQLSMCRTASAQLRDELDPSAEEPIEVETPPVDFGILERSAARRNEVITASFGEQLVMLVQRFNYTPWEAWAFVAALFDHHVDEYGAYSAAHDGRYDHAGGLRNLESVVRFEILENGRSRKIFRHTRDEHRAQLQRVVADSGHLYARELVPVYHMLMGFGYDPYLIYQHQIALEHEIGITERLPIELGPDVFRKYENYNEALRGFADDALRLMTGRPHGVRPDDEPLFKTYRDATSPESSRSSPRFGVVDRPSSKSPRSASSRTFGPGSPPFRPSTGPPYKPASPRRGPTSPPTYYASGSLSYDPDSPGRRSPRTQNPSSPQAAAARPTPPTYPPPNPTTPPAPPRYPMPTSPPLRRPSISSSSTSSRPPPLRRSTSQSSNHPTHSSGAPQEFDTHMARNRPATTTSSGKKPPPTPFKDYRVRKVDPLRYQNRLYTPRRLPITPTKSHLPPSPRRRGPKPTKCRACGRAFRPRKGKTAAAGSGVQRRSVRVRKGVERLGSQEL